MNIDNEQWKSDGDCYICRRKEYCRKTCAANRKAVHRAINEAISNCTNKVVGASYIGIEKEFLKDLADSAKGDGDKNADT